MGGLVYRCGTSRRRYSMLDLKRRSIRNSSRQAMPSLRFIPDVTFGIPAQITLYLRCSR